MVERCICYVEFCKIFLFIRIRLSPRSTRTDELLPFTTLVRSTSHLEFLVLRNVAPSGQATDYDQQNLPVYAELLDAHAAGVDRSEEHTSELQSIMRTSHAIFCQNKKHSLHTPTPSHRHKPHTSLSSQLNTVCHTH